LGNAWGQQINSLHRLNKGIIFHRMGEELTSGTGEWYAVRVRSDAAIVAIGIEKAGMEAFLPVELVRVTYRGTHRGRSEVQWRPLFPGHLFAMFNPGRDLSRLCSLQGVDGVLRPGGRLVPIADDAVAALRAAERRGLFDAAVGCRLAVAEDERPDSRFAAWVTKIKRERGSKKRTALLMSLLIGNHSR
jgi:hypothetical protein